ATQSFGGALISAFFALPEAPGLAGEALPDDVQVIEDYFEDIATPEPEGTAEPEPEEKYEPGELFYQRGEIILQEGIDNSTPLPSDGIIMQNTSGLEIDIERLMSEPLEIVLAEEGPQVLVIHTHGSEAYTQVPGEEYEESDPYRTQNKSRSIISVGDVLAEELSARGISVIHDRGTYDYPSYADSYNRTLAAIQGYLEKYPSISLVIDIHRDASPATGDQFKTIAEIDGSLCSQIKLVVGTNGAGLTHPNWEQNMKLALRLQYEMNRSYPTLARPVGASEYRYNQHATAGSLLVEVGAAGNTFSESVDAVRYFADAYANVILG
ncbi:MAG: stage II sporulation protein P, partial [Clostridiales bacterium]|nr:stage II sporulation protein P [Clostridiales bacterium]